MKDIGETYNNIKVKQSGFTLMELLVVVSIIVLLFAFFFLNMRTQVRRGQDARRKTDLAKLQKAFEEYSNDRRCYPPAGALDTCGSADLSPYLKLVPCDPVLLTSYLYVSGEPSRCSGYRVCAKLEDKKDPDIARLGCHPDNGCGFGAGYNYCVSMGYGVTPAGFDPNASPTPTPAPTPPGATPTPTPSGPTPTPAPTPPGATSTPTPTPSGPTPTPGGGGGGNYACTPGGDCNYYADPESAGCPATFSDVMCDGACVNPFNRCTF